MIGISPLTLGTAQLGLDYGIANRSGKPTGSTGVEILDAALRNGITTIDTSRDYGDSEAVIGDFLRAGREAVDRVIVSKFGWSSRALTDRDLARKEARTSVGDSLNALGISALPILLYHKTAEEPMDQVLRFLPEVIRELREEGLIGCGGISLYYPEEVFAVMEEESLTALQLPVSVFDQRILHNGGLQALAERGKTVFARSVFLQGLLFLETARLPEKLRPAAPYIQALQDIAERAQMDVAQLAFVYVRDLPGISSMVFGAEHPTQVVHTAAWLAAPPLLEEVREEINKVLGNVPEELIIPGRW